jgi:biopolymer transport protein TolR
MAEINVVHYIDVMLVLLVIFMITTPLLSQGVNVDLPESKTQAIQPKDKEPLVVSVDATGRYYLNVAENANQPLALNDISYLVKTALNTAQQEGKEQPVFVKADQHVDYGKVMAAMATLQGAGAKSVGLISQAPLERG